MKLRYINRVDMCPARHLHLVRPLPDGVHAYAPDYVPWESLCISGLAALEVTDNVEDGVRTFTSKLTLTLADRPALPNGPVGFRLTTTGGEELLLGLAFRPFPTVALSDSLPSKPASACACTLTATWEGSHAPMIIVC